MTTWQLVWTLDPNYHGLYKDGLLVFEAPSDCLDPETVMNLHKYGALTGDLELYECSDEYYYASVQEDGYPKKFFVISSYLKRVAPR